MSLSPQLAVIPIVMINIALGFLSYKIIRYIDKEGDTAMAELRLKRDRTLKEIKILFYSHTAETIILIIVLYGGIVSKSFYVNIGRTASVFYGIPFLYVIYKWSKRF